MHTSAAVSRYMLSLLDPMLVDVNDSHCALEPQPGAKTAGWLLGHLAVSGDFARRMCGRPSLCPTNWTKHFAPGSKPSLNPDDYPPIARLNAAVRQVYADLCVVAESASAETLAAPNPYAPARAAFPTVGLFVAYLMTAHLGYHLGQLAGWRAAAGLGRVPRPDSLAA